MRLVRPALRCVRAVLCRNSGRGFEQRCYAFIIVVVRDTTVRTHTSEAVPHTWQLTLNGSLCLGCSAGRGRDRAD